jgi:hypothetical protein
LATVLHFTQFVPGANMFKISTINTQSERTLVVEGTLVEPWLAELRTTWKDASQDLDGRKLVINLSNLTVISREGEEAIFNLMKDGAKFSCCGVLNRHVLKQLARKCPGKLRDALTKPNRVIETAKSPRR